ADQSMSQGNNRSQPQLAELVRGIGVAELVTIPTSAQRGVVVDRGSPPEYASLWGSSPSQQLQPPLALSRAGLAVVGGFDRLSLRFQGRQFALGTRSAGSAAPGRNSEERLREEFLEPDEQRRATADNVIQLAAQDGAIGFAGEA